MHNALWFYNICARVFYFRGYFTAELLAHVSDKIKIRKHCFRIFSFRSFRRRAPPRQSRNIGNSFSAAASAFLTLFKNSTADMQPRLPKAPPEAYLQHSASCPIQGSPRCRKSEPSLSVTDTKQPSPSLRAKPARQAE